MTEPPEDVIRAVQAIHGCGREEALVIIEDDIVAVIAAAGHRCGLCETEVRPGDDVRPLGTPEGPGLAHRECLLRNVLGGIGHLEDHNHWCNEMHDPDGGRSYRQSALEVDAWVHEHGVSAATLGPW